MWFIGVEVEQETSAPPPKKNPGSTPVEERKTIPYPPAHPCIGHIGELSTPPPPPPLLGLVEASAQADLSPVKFKPSLLCSLSDWSHSISPQPHKA